MAPLICLVVLVAWAHALLINQDELWAGDAVVLAEIGGRLFDQSLNVRVTLPCRLLRTALAAWQRDDVGEDDGDVHEFRSQAADLALIGLRVETQGIAGEGDVTVVLNAWQIGAALDAADAAGLLTRPETKRN